MTRRHRRTVLEMSPRALQRTFTLLEAADLLQMADVSGLDQLPLDPRAEELGRRLNAQRRFRNSHKPDDIQDPLGRSAGVHAQVADAIATALRPLVDVLLAPQPSGNASTSPLEALNRT
jgi:protein-tyrosine phosphatase